MNAVLKPTAAPDAPHMPALPRIDPRRPAVITPAGLRRIVLGSALGERVHRHAVAAHDAPRPLRSAGPFSRCIVAVAQAERGTLDDHARETIAAAALLAGPDCEVIAAVLGACGDDAAALGADRLVAWAGFDRDAYQPERALQWLQALQRQWQPVAWLMPDRDDDGERGRRFAVAGGLGLATHVVELARDRLRVRAGATEDELRPLAEVMLLERHVARTALPFVGLGVRETAAPDGAAMPEGVEDLGVQAGDPQTLALEEADLILAAGNGVSALDTFHALARALGAATGASRIAVDDGRFPRAKQIGATGKTVGASCYVALGISGAVQHLQGIKACRHVIAVNLDPAAPIAQRADLMVVEDSGRLMRALLALVEEATREGAAA